MNRTVLIVDDQARFRVLARELLEVGGFTVIGEADSARAAIDAARDLRPDVVLMDVRLTGESGVDATRVICAGDEPPVVVLTSTGDYADEASRCGAAGFIPKARLSGITLRAALAPT